MIIGGAIGVLLMVVLVSCSIEAIPAGHVGVVSTFGEVKTGVLEEGLNIKNPLSDVVEFDARQKAHTDSIGLTSKDQLITTFDITFKYRLIKTKASSMYKETGSPRDVIQIHMIPKVRSLCREVGKTIERSEDFFKQEVQSRMQNALVDGLASLSEKGINIDEVLIRKIQLPKLIQDAINSKKAKAQQAEEEKEKLKLFIVQQKSEIEKQKALAESDTIKEEKNKRLAIIKAETLIITAQANADVVLIEATASAEAKSKLINTLGLEGYIQLKSMESLETFQNGNHFIFADPKSNNVMPFMNLDKIMRK